MKRQKLSKTQAASFYKSLLGSAAGIEVVERDIHYVVERGISRYEVWPVDMWPDGVRILCYFLVGNVGVRQIYFDPSTFEPDWKTTEREVRKGEREGR